MKKLTALLLALVMLLSLTACGAKVDAPATEAATAPAPAPDEATAAPAANNGLDPNEKVTLHLYGTANFIDVGAEGTIDLVSGVEMPGYNELIAAWNEKYPNVEVVVETCPWDNWITSIQTAVLSGGVDIILHGATLTELCEPSGSLSAKRFRICRQAVRHREPPLRRPEQDHGFRHPVRHRALHCIR